MVFQLPRRPRDRDELHALIKAMWGVDLPRVKVCPEHTAPFEAVAHAFFAEQPNYAVWYASRGSGKSLALAVLGLTKAFVDEVDVTIIGGSMTQSLNVRNHMRDMLSRPNAPAWAVDKDLVTLIQTIAGSKIEPLPASQKTVRGKHPVLELLDEVDEMDLDIFDASLGQAMEQPSKNPALGPHKLAEYVVASSTWQNPAGTFSQVIDRARENKQPVFTWCWRELLEQNGGWMSQRFIDGKRRTVSAQMWHTEYELNEPAASDRAIDLDKVEEYFIDYAGTEHETHKPDDDCWIWEHYETQGVYVVGADWGKSVDYTVIAVVRVDVHPRRLVKLRIAKRRPWPEMIGWFRADIKTYAAIDAKHDKTGLGGALHDWIDDEDTSGFVFVGRPRTELLLDYITAFEHGHYRLPRRTEVQHEQLERLRRAHRGVTVADVYAPGKWDSHLPDEIAAMALAHRAATHAGIPAEVPFIKKDNSPRKVDAQFHVQPGGSRVEGIVTKEDDRDDESTPMLWVPAGADSSSGGWF